GRNAKYATELVSGLTQAGYSTLGVDLRGWGETTPKTKKVDKRYAWEENFFWRSLELGHPLLGMRVADLLNVARKQAGEFRRVFLVGIEGGGTVAAHAAAIEPSIAGVVVHR